MLYVGPKNGYIWAEDYFYLYKQLGKNKIVNKNFLYNFKFVLS